ncbi:MAG: DUF1816 domain-containing protein [Leptolyngbyaceae cyanobacterium SM2_5_2]|nr:DUF1816 domain-containing protein [Leptolyngbyaceae cyanobacterium SM2_5_2]
MKLSNIILPFTQSKQQAWWVEIQTQVPNCTYYFGPFDSCKEAKFSQVGYIDDLVQEGARDIVVNIKQIHPQQLTVIQDECSPLV